MMRSWIRIELFFIISNEHAFVAFSEVLIELLSCTALFKKTKVKTERN